MRAMKPEKEGGVRKSKEDGVEAGHRQGPDFGCSDGCLTL